MHVTTGELVREEGEVLVREEEEGGGVVELCHRTGQSRITRTLEEEGLTQALC